nr:uncharacterized mitochondrial protein AtMg00810-like [Tanacetum cinerariifolium]
MMGKISFFLRLQISQSSKGIFINQSKYALESLNKYGFESCDPVDTPMVEKSKLDEDKEGKSVDLSHYRGMIGTLLYLTASRPDLQFAICMCACNSNAHAHHCLEYKVQTGDEALVPHARRLRIERSNFRLLSDISSKESTLQLVYDVLRQTPFFKAFLVIADVLEIYMNSDAYKEYYAVATGATPPKTKASVRKTKSSSDTTVTPPPTTAAGNNDDDDAQDDDDDDQEDANKDDDDQEEGDEDDQEEGSDDEQASDEEGEQFIHPSLSTHDEKATRDEECFDPIPKTHENTEDEGNGEENLGMNVGMEEGQDEEGEEDKLYRDVNINLGRGELSLFFEKTFQMDVQTPTSVAPLHVSAPTLTPSTIATTTTTLEANFSEFMQTNQFAGAVSSILEIVQRYMDQQMNKAVKALVEAYESDKIILDTYEDTVTLKKRHDDDVDKDEEPSTGSDRGSKRRREGKKPESASAPKEKATRSAGKSTKGSKS